MITTLFRFLFNAAVELVAHFTAAVLSHEAVQAATAHIILCGMNAFLRQPNLDDHVRVMSETMAKNQEEAARSAGQDFPKLAGRFLQGMLSPKKTNEASASLKKNSNNNNKATAQQQHATTDNNNNNLTPQKTHKSSIKATASLSNQNETNDDDNNNNIQRTLSFPNLTPPSPLPSPPLTKNITNTTSTATTTTTTTTADNDKDKKRQYIHEKEAPPAKSNSFLLLPVLTNALGKNTTTTNNNNKEGLRQRMGSK